MAMIPSSNPMIVEEEKKQDDEQQQDQILLNDEEILRIMLQKHPAVEKFEATTTTTTKTKEASIWSSSLSSTTIPSSLLHRVTKLNLSGVGLSSLPDNMNIAVPNLSILFASNNQFEQMPSVIGQCTELQMVAFKSNHMTSIHPDALQSQLRWLILTDNKIQHIPDTIGRCCLLQKCMLSGNLLSSLPDSIENCTNLELIRLASNRLRDPPMKLLQIPSLCWVALSDNPFLSDAVIPESVQQQQQLPILYDVDDDEYSNGGEVLGEGAGGVTRKVWWKKQKQYVAVKTYRGEMTSDGTPDMERAVATAAGRIAAAVAAAAGGGGAADCRSSGLIGVWGETENGSLVMEYLAGYSALADPPSLQSCSRDVYPDAVAMTACEAGSLVSAVLSAIASLHKVGIAHGDLYGHNILLSKDMSDVRLSDFGAAFFYNLHDERYCKLLQAIELRAFAILTEEVISRIESKKDDAAAQSLYSVSLLKELVSYCRQPSRTVEQVHNWWKQEQQQSS